jgi:hypothetical protein
MLNLLMTYKQRTKLFTMNKHTVRRYFLYGPQALEALETLGRHMVIEDQSEANLTTLLSEVFGAGKTMTWKQLL